MGAREFGEIAAVRVARVVADQLSQIEAAGALIADAIATGHRVWVTPTMTLDHLLFAAGSTLYVWVGVFFEERSLLRQWGGQYEEYRERVGAIVPTFVSRRSTQEIGVTFAASRSEERA